MSFKKYVINLIYILFKIICTAITIWNSKKFSDESIPNFIDGNINYPDPCFASFNKICIVDLSNSSFIHCSETFELMDKASVLVKILVVSSEMALNMNKLNKGKLKNLKVGELRMKITDTEISDKIIKVLNNIHSSSYYIYNLNCSYDNLKLCLSMDPINIKFMDQNNTMLDTPLLLFDSDSNQKLSICSKSVTFEINTEGFKDLVLLETHKVNFETSGCLFVPFSSVNGLQLCRKQNTANSLQFDEQLEHSSAQGIIKTSGFVVPVRNLDKANFHNNQILDLIKSNQNTVKCIFKAKCINCTAKYIDDLLEISQLFGDYTSHICYSYDNWGCPTIIKNPEFDIPTELSLINPKLSKIEISHILPPEEFKLVCEILCSRRIRFSLCIADLKFNLLSECLAALSLCANCPELAFINFNYLKSDCENEIEEIDHAIRDFRKKFGFIETLKINKKEE